MLKRIKLCFRVDLPHTFKAPWITLISFYLLAPSIGSAQLSDQGETSQREASEPCLETPLKGMACIPSGAFTRGSERPRTCRQGEVRRIPKDQPNHRPASIIELSTYYMDLTEVTYSAYQVCAKAKKCKPRRPQYADYNAPQQPMVGLSWYEADQYCRAQGKHLPTEAEWEKAARGPDRELYPWGNADVDCQRAVIKDKSGRSCGVKKARGKYPDKGKVLPVKSRPAGRYGIYDLIGNAEEWTADWYSRDWESCGQDCVGRDPQGPCPDQAPHQGCKGYRKKVVRGGSWYWPRECATSWTRRPHYPSNKPYHHFGFRCAASLEEARLLSKVDAH